MEGKSIKPQTGKVQTFSDKHSKPLANKAKGLLARFKIFITKKPKIRLPKVFVSLFSDTKIKNKTIQERNITKQVQKNKLVKNTETKQSSDNNIDPYKDDEDTYGYLPGFKNIQSKDSGDALLKTSKLEEHVYENLKSAQGSDAEYVSIQEIQQRKKEKSAGSIDSYMKALGNYLQTGKPENTTNSSEETKAQFRNLKEKSKKFTPEEVVEANNKFTDISCPRHSSATKHNIYHANKITIGESSYIAAQGPYTQGNDISIAGDFIAMIAENDSPISISLIKESEFIHGRKPNKKLPPQQIGETINIPAKIKNGETVREATTITKINSIKDDVNSVQVDVLSINGKQHVRIYDLTWEDYTGGDPKRLAAISLFTERISDLPELKDRKGKPTIVNCNAGVGRTGTAILIDHMRKEIEQGKTLSEGQLEKDILHIRNDRPILVQQDVQLETLKTFIAQGNDFIKKIEGSFKV